MIKNTCLLGRMKKLNILRKQNPKLAVCITMYNENEAELKTTMRGVLQNYNAMYLDPEIRMRQKDMVVVCICDGFERIPDSFKEFATANKFLNVELLKQKGFMYEDKQDGKWKMKSMEDLMDKDVQNIPKNCLHMFQICSWEFGLSLDTLQGRRINFIFAVK